ncbi:MAG: GlxA family transcriptional regulator [Hyphomicrobiaceae bacterium]|nr:GlxA family transcriptional regulator [Hyphomicrobiaceae bacterium]
MNKGATSKGAGRSSVRRKTEGRAALSVGFILASNFTLSAFSLLVDVLRLAADEGDNSRPIRCRWEVISSSPRIEASCGVEVSRTSGFVDPTEFDYIAVVGGILHKGRQLDDQTVAYLRKAAGLGVPLIGICTGSFILSRAGLMGGRACCVSWFHYSDFKSEFPDGFPVADRLFIVDRDRITCAGGSGVADLGAYLVERHLGGSSAQKSLHILLVNHARQGTHAQPHPHVEASAPNAIVSRALLLMEQNMTAPLRISVLAAQLGISSRQLDRLFHAALGERPSRAYRRLRLRYAMWLLQNTRRSITEVGLEAGFVDSAHFTRHFKQLFNITPSKVERPPMSARGVGEQADLPNGAYVSRDYGVRVAPQGDRSQRADARDMALAAPLVRS